MMKQQEYLLNLLALCAKYGHTYVPLTLDEIGHLYEIGVDVDTAYEVACDVACGFDFYAAIPSNAAA